MAEKQPAVPYCPKHGVPYELRDGALRCPTAGCVHFVETADHKEPSVSDILEKEDQETT